jgi:hypothetical protein
MLCLIRLRRLLLQPLLHHALNSLHDALLNVLCLLSLDRHNSLRILFTAAILINIDFRRLVPPWSSFEVVRHFSLSLATVAVTVLRLFIYRGQHSVPMQYRPSKVTLFNDHIREVKAVLDLRLLDDLLGRDDVAMNLLLLEV